MNAKYEIVWTTGSKCLQHSGSHIYCGINHTTFANRASAEKAVIALLGRADVCSAEIKKLQEA